MPRKRRPRSTAQSSGHHPDTSAPIASHSSTPDGASQPRPLFSPSRPLLGHSTQPGSSSSPHPHGRPLPLNWTERDCFILAHYMYANSKDYDDKVEWWEKIASHLPGKTVQELRLFSYLYMEAYGELPPDPEWITDSDTDEITQSDTDTKESIKLETEPMDENPEHSSVPPPSVQAPLPTAEALVLRKYFEWTLEESRTLLDLIERNPSILITRGGWKELARNFTGKKASDVKRHIAMVQLAAVFMGALNSIPDWQRISVPAAQDAPECNVDKQASTSVQADESAGSSDDKLGRLREPQGECCLDSPPSTSGMLQTRILQSPSSKPSSSRSGRGGRRGRRKNKASKK